jgi:hypothetical protein
MALKEQEEFDRHGRRRRRRQRSPLPMLMGILIGGAALLCCLITVGVGGYFLVTKLILVDKPRDRLVGQWEYLSPDIPGGSILLDIRKDKSITITGITPRVREDRKGTWEVLEEKGDRIKIRVSLTGEQARDWEVEFLPDDRIRVHFLTTGAQTTEYRRKR